MEEFYTLENTTPNFRLCNKTFSIDWSKINTLEDIKLVLQGLEIRVNLYSEKVPQHLEELFKQDFLKEEQ